MEYNLTDEARAIAHIVLTTAEVAEELGVSRQSVALYVKNSALKVLKNTPSGFLFLREDVNAFKNCNNNPFNYYAIDREIHGGGTSDFHGERTLEIIGDPKNISSIEFFFFDWDALLKNYFSLYEAPQENILYSVNAPRFVVTMADGRCLMFDCGNCGYGGSGPHASEAILKKCGIIDGDMIKNVFSCRHLAYYYDGTDWSCEIYRKDGGVEEFYEFNGAGSRIGYYNGNLVFLANEPLQYAKGYVDKEALIMQCKLFAPNPVSLTILAPDDCTTTGHYVRSPFRAGKYNLILKDTSGREVWFSGYVDPKNPVKRQEKIADILKIYGLEQGNINVWPEAIKAWLGMRVNTITYNLK